METKCFVIFFKLNPVFVLNEFADTEDEAIRNVANRFGIDQRFLEAYEKGHFNDKKTLE